MPIDPRHRAGLLANRAHWDEAAPLHAASDLYDLDAFRAGADRIRPFELDELGPVMGRDLLHLQCHIGTDTLSWARHGARVSGVDFSAESIEIARRLARECGIEAHYWCADVYDALHAVGGRTFDIVYTGLGALVWLPELGPWARVVADLLRDGGVLYLVEVHPFVGGVVRDGRTFGPGHLRGRVHGVDRGRGDLRCSRSHVGAHDDVRARPLDQ